MSLPLRYTRFDCVRKAPKFEHFSNPSVVPCVQAHVPVPDDAWEYQIRKSLNDAAYNGLQYVPYCSTMPVQEKCDDPKFMWVSCNLS